MDADRRLMIRWFASGDIDRNLTQAEVMRMVVENECEWVGGDVVDKAGNVVGKVSRDDD